MATVFCRKERNLCRSARGSPGAKARVGLCFRKFKYKLLNYFITKAENTAQFLRIKKFLKNFQRANGKREIYNGDTREGIVVFLSKISKGLRGIMGLGETVYAKKAKNIRA